MQLPSSKPVKIFYQRHQTLCHVSLIVLLAGLRVITSRVLACPDEFDCNAYIAMVDHWGYQADLAGHHAMRVLPSILVWGLHHFGISIEMGFRILSGMLYIVFGGLVYLFLNKQSIKPVLALSLSLLCLAPHEAMRIPLQLVYQSCDMMVYPMGLLIFICSLQNRVKSLFLLTFLSIFIRQNLFIFGVLSFIFCLIRNGSLARIAALGLLIVVYAVCQTYYQATGTFVELLSPPENFFTLSHLVWVLQDSKLIEILIPILPMILVFYKPLINLIFRYWHVSLFVCITVGQPFLGYHLTGNNFARLALQGLWFCILGLGLVWPKKWQQNWIVNIFLIYSAAVYFTWGLKQRVWMMLGLIFCVSAIMIWNRFQSTQELGKPSDFV